MPSSKKAVSFRPEPALSADFDEMLSSISVDGDDRRNGFSGRPVDSVTRTAMLEALMRYAVAQARARKPGLLRLAGLREKGAKYRAEGS